MEVLGTVPGLGMRVKRPSALCNHWHHLKFSINNTLVMMS